MATEAAIYLANTPRPTSWLAKIPEFSARILAEITGHAFSPPRILGRLLDPSMLEQLESQTSEQRRGGNLEMRMAENIWKHLKTGSFKYAQPQCTFGPCVPAIFIWSMTKVLRPQNATGPWALGILKTGRQELANWLGVLWNELAFADHLINLWILWNRSFGEFSTDMAKGKR